MRKPALPIFDALCRICERHRKEMLPLLAKMHLFKFPGRAHEILPKKFDDRQIELIRDHFFLPFTYVAVEDSATCVLLWDTVPDQVGWSCKRYFLECLPVRASLEDFRNDNEDQPDLDAVLEEFRARGVKGDPYIITVGWIHGYDEMDETSFRASGNVDVVFTATERQSVSPPRVVTKERNNPMKSPTLRNAMVAAQEVAYFNSPDRFILEQTQAKRAKVKRGKVARSFNRSVFTLMTTREIRDSLGLDSESGTPKAPHARRKHFRTYRSPRYKEKRGETVTIPATWIGPTELTVDGQKYKVRIDL